MKRQFSILRIFILFLSMLYCQMISGQTTVKPPMLTPPPPDVSALGKFGLIPVSNFSGIPSITYPVYTIKEGDLNLPISLMYHAGGVKVKEEASEVGLGWALSAGGSIVSTVRGAPDFEGGFANNYPDMPDDPDIILQSKNPFISYQNNYYLWVNNFNQFTANGVSGVVYSGLSFPHNGVGKEYFYNFQVGYDGKAPDFASDLYMINIGERSYKFVFDNNFKPVLLGDGSLKIEIIPNGYYPDWKITDEKGIVYFFTQKQLNSTNSTDPYYVENRVSHNLNTWYLTKIVSPVNGEINFDYLYSTQSYTHPLPVIGETQLVGNVSPHTSQSRGVITTASYSIYQQLNINKINFSDGFVMFIYDEQRKDLQNARRLKAIEIRNNKGALIKKVLLNNDDYFTSSGFGGVSGSNVQLSQYTNDNHTKRLKLNSVTELDSLEANINKRTVYSYNENINLPAKLSYSVDHWGYFNGAFNGQFIPGGSVFSNGAWQSFPGADREASPINAQANILTSVQYPTGGKSTFEYETNQFIRKELVTTYRDTVSNGYKASGASTLSVSGFMDANGNLVAANTWNNKRLKIFCMVDRHGSYPSDYFFNVVLYENGMFLKRIPIPSSSYASAQDSSVVIKGGSNYRVYLEPYSQAFFNNCEVRLQVYVEKTSSTSTYVDKTIYSGGLRVSKITNYDPLAETTNVKKFTYIDGREDDKPIYVSQQGSDYFNQSPQQDALNIFSYRYGQSIYPFSDGRDAPCFGYSTVKISESTSGNLNGLSEFNYNAGSSFNINTILYFSNQLSNTWIINPVMASVPSIPGGRGDLIEEKHYKLSAGNLMPVVKDYYYYDRENPRRIWQMLFNQGLSQYTSPGYDNGQEFKIYAHQFAIPVYRNVVVRKEHTEYDISGTQAQITYENYMYDKTNGHFQLIKKSVGNSRGDTLNTYYKYPQDYPDLNNASGLDSISSGIKLLQQKHIILPLESFTELVTPGTNLIKKYFGGTINIFNPDQPTLKQILVSETVTPLNSFDFSTVSNGLFLKNSSYTSRFRMTYDYKNRLTQQAADKGSVTSFLWGNSLSVPLAQGNNVKATDIFYENFEEYNGPGLSTVGDSKSGKYSKIGGYSKSISGLSNGTYVLSYWKKENTGLWSFVVIDNILVDTSAYIIAINEGYQLDNIRFQPKNAQMTTFEFDPLVGMTSSTDAKGMTTTYEYDAFQRLKIIKDQNGNILKQTNYHYKN
ncbi:RHS repeat protein [Pedobacter sp. PF22-3]|uniref:RHS repeat domain-containing protein n=1 Tax=Pedobacter sp. PF22-3 TaxID=2994467 RepID=UPI002247E8CF|nr:RHS repeat domain-containing protein [Pedobacter sp. PF22-3]MCX2495293.1 RHS repeat protein [Pedobacter sp. PF22-3]